MTDTLKAFEKADQKLFEAQQEIKSLRVQVEQLSRVNKEYKDVLTPIWDYGRKNVKVELGKSITEALIESHKLLQSQVWSLEQRCKLLEEDSKDTAQYVEIQRGELAKANEDYKELFCAFESCQDELKKANKLVKELEHGNRACAIAIRELVERGDIEPLMVGNDALDKIVNKFAIEKKIEELDLIVELAHSRKGGISTIDIANRAHELSKQLRTEQEL
jgi:chromosome segregation ATPase